MIRRKEDIRLQERPNIRGGEGVIHTYHLLEPEELRGHGTLCSVMLIEPGSSLGKHPHGPDGEIYILLEGELTVDDNGAVSTMKAGDTMFTTDNEYHSVRNDSDTTAKLIAIVIR